MALLRSFTIIGRFFRGMIVFVLLVSTGCAVDRQEQQFFAEERVPLVEVVPEQGALKHPVKYPEPTTPYGLWIGTEDQLHTSDFIDQDGDLIDDRWQPAPGQPEQH